MEANLQGAILVRATLEETLLNKACLKGAYLYRANLKDAILIGADLEEADLERSDLSGALLYEANLKGAYLYAAVLKGTKLRRANLEGAVILREGHLEGAHLQRATLGGNETLPLTNLRNVFFDEATNLRDITLGNMKHGFVRLADVHWSNVNLAVINWDPIAMLGDERDAHQCRKQRDSWIVQLNMLEQAIRANHQLVAILQNQAMLEEADYFGYRTQGFHRKVLQLQFLLQLERLWEKLHRENTGVEIVQMDRSMVKRTWMWKVAVQIGRGVTELWHWLQRTWVWKVVLVIGQGIYRLWCWFQTTWVWKIIVKLGKIRIRLMAVVAWAWWCVTQRGKYYFRAFSWPIGRLWIQARTYISLLLVSRLRNSQEFTTNFIIFSLFWTLWS